MPSATAQMRLRPPTAAPRTRGVTDAARHRTLCGLTWRGAEWDRTALSRFAGDSVVVAIAAIPVVPVALWDVSAAALVGLGAVCVRAAGRRSRRRADGGRQANRTCRDEDTKHWPSVVVLNLGETVQETPESSQRKL